MREMKLQWECIWEKNLKRKDLSWRFLFSLLSLFHFYFNIFNSVYVLLNTVCRVGWPWTDCDLTGSASSMLKLKMCAIVPWRRDFFFQLNWVKLWDMKNCVAFFYCITGCDPSSGNMFPSSSALRFRVLTACVIVKFS